jgi:NDP-sugar pyrophosphorylase family protein
VRAFISNAEFRDIGTPADYLRTSLAVGALEGRVVESTTGARSIVHASARLIRSIVWDDVVIEQHSELVECIVADGVRILAGSRFSRVAVTSARARTAEPGELRVGDVLLTPLALDPGKAVIG